MRFKTVIMGSIIARFVLKFQYRVNAPEKKELWTILTLKSLDFIRKVLVDCSWSD